MKKVFNILNIILKVIFILSFIFSMYVLSKVDILPLNYKIIFISVFVVILVLSVLGIIFKNKYLNIISSILNILFISVIVLASIYLFKTDDFVSKLKNNELRETYYLAVLKDSEYENINDLNNLKIGTFYNNIKTYELVLKNINSKINSEITNYDDLLELTDLLLNKEVDAILINEANKTLLEEEHELIHIQLKYIYNVTTKTKVEEIVKDIDVVENPFAIYISGIDAYDDIASVSRSDVNIIAVINPKNNKILLVTIPRDYYVTLYGTNSKDKLTHAGLYGIESSVKTIENLLDIDINYYVRLNFSTLINAIDAIGGVNVYSEYTFNTYGTQFYKGYNYVDGTKALAFSRARYNFTGGDRVRGENQLRVIEAIINKMASSRVLVTNYLDILDSLGNSFQTNIDSSRLYDLVKFQLFHMPKWNIEKISLNGSGRNDYTYTYKKTKLYVMVPDIKTVNVAKNKIIEIMK